MSRALATILSALLISSCLSLQKNEVPLVMILMHDGPANAAIQVPNPPAFYTYVGWSYVEWISQTGAMPVLVPYDIPLERLAVTLNEVQAVLIPGGASPLSSNTGTDTTYMRAVKYIIQHAKKSLDNGGTNFPVFGINEGMHAIVAATLGTNMISAGYTDIAVDHPIKIEGGVLEHTKLFNSIEKSNLQYVSSEGMMYFKHSAGIDIEKNPENKDMIEKEYYIVGTSNSGKEHNGTRFVSMIEHKQYPFFGTQFHPEKSQFERGREYRFLDRSLKTIEFASDLASAFVEIASKKAPAYDKLPDWIKSHFSIYIQPINSFYNGHEKVYMHPRLYYDLPDVDDQGRPPAGLGVAMAAVVYDAGEAIEERYAGSGLFDDGY